MKYRQLDQIDQGLQRLKCIISYCYSRSLKLLLLNINSGSADQGFNVLNALFPTDIQKYCITTEYYYSLFDCHTMSKLILKNSLHRP